MLSLVGKLGLASLGATLILGVASAHAATFPVTSTDDTGPGTLRQAIEDANTTAGADVITISATGTISLATPLPTLSEEVAIQGPGASHLNVDGGGANTVFAVGGGVPAKISDLTATNGMSTGTGGGIFVGGTLTLTRVTVSQSMAETNGGGIEVIGGAKLEAIESTISGNQANVAATGTGGGINVESGGTLVVRDSTVSGNQSTTNAGGVRVQGTATIQRSTINGNMALGGFAGGIGVTSVIEAGAGSLKLENSTVTDNTALINAGGVGGFGSVEIVSSTITSNNSVSGANVVAEGGGTTTIRNSIVAYPVTGSNCVSSGATLTSLGYNIDDGSAASCGFTQSTDQTGVDPKLGGLVTNGGATLTRAPSADSPAVNHGTAEGLSASMAGRVSDQRGVIRPVGSQADIGAVELAPPTAVTGVSSNVTTTGATIAGSATNPGVFDAQAFFQYGPAGNPTQSQTNTILVPPASNSLPVSADLSGLLPGTTYHYRLVVNNAEGSSAGDDRTFTTGQAPTPTPPTPTPPDVPASVLISHRRVPLVKGKIKVILICLGAKGKRCKGKLVLTPTDRTTRFRSAGSAAGVPFDFKAGAKLTLKMGLPDKTRSQLAKSRRAVVLATATLTSGGPTTSRLLTINKH